MPIKWLTEDDSQPSSDLPWLRDYMKQFKDDTKEREVLGLCFGDNGVLVLTCQWKAFVYKRQKTYNHLKEAVDVWVNSTELLPRLVAKPVKGGKVVLGLDDTFCDWYWEESDEGKYVPLQQDGSTNLGGKSNSTATAPPNPFLPGSTPPKASTSMRKNGGQTNTRPAKRETA